MTAEPTAGPAVPEADEDLADLLLDLTVPHEDIGGILALRRRVAADPALRATADDALAHLVAGMGAGGSGRTEGERPKLPGLPEDIGVAEPYLPVYVYVAALPVVRAHHRERGVPDEIGRRTLADLGRQLAVHRRRYGTGGLTSPGWPALHFRGELYQLGRLQFERAGLGARTAAAVSAAGAAASAGDPCLSLHIPDFLGPLAPGAVDASLARAKAFFSRHFPEDRATAATCHSWLLDPQLAGYLPPESNIMRFQSRFRPARPGEAPETDDRDPVGFVFGDPRLDHDRLPRRTTLERAIGDHLRAGRHWHAGHGWLAL
ncbi:acyltransferase domain-containing protein [Streptomyces montanisoli]|uniref:acyltransferase domain-containing protein n=1 Tax=Streptomyces montanisoli TaxID=2798581 RepID=UPI0027DCD63D|nr:acyltransferase domain-containing protein [Streptomyces montanisoli]